MVRTRASRSSREPAPAARADRRAAESMAPSRADRIRRRTGSTSDSTASGCDAFCGSSRLLASSQRNSLPQAQTQVSIWVSITLGLLVTLVLLVNGKGQRIRKTLVRRPFFLALKIPWWKPRPSCYARLWRRVSAPAPIQAVRVSFALRARCSYSCESRFQHTSSSTFPSHSLDRGCPESMWRGGKLLGMIAK